MKNVTIAIDDETHKAARIYAAQHGTSLSALVKGYLDQLGAAPASQGVREMPMSYFAPPPIVPAVKKSRQPGGLRGKIGMTDDFNEWPADVMASFTAWGDDQRDPLP